METPPNGRRLAFRIQVGLPLVYLPDPAGVHVAAARYTVEDHAGVLSIVSAHD
jgi:hypothetical protein